MSSVWNKGISLSVFGESHSAAIGLVLDHLPAGVPIDLDEVQTMMRRRQAKRDGTTTSRVEPDVPQILSGLVNGKTTGTPLAMVIENTNVRSKDYSELAVKMRPGHADFPAQVRYLGANDIRGGGHFSGRLTACLVAAGAICGQILAQKGVYAGAHLVRLANRPADDPIDPVQVTCEDLKRLRELPFPVQDQARAAELKEAIHQARMSCDSVGGVVEVCAVGMPVGIGDPMLDSVESILAALFFSIPGVKGVEFGEGFHAADLRGSQNNDPYRYEGERVVTTTNHAGGILGGITNGMPITARVALKPTSSIAQEQQTVNIQTKQNDTLQVIGRHDPCIAVRAVPVVEACMNLGLLAAWQMMPHDFSQKGELA